MLMTSLLNPSEPCRGLHSRTGPVPRFSRSLEDCPRLEIGAEQLGGDLQRPMTRVTSVSGGRLTSTRSTAMAYGVLSLKGAPSPNTSRTFIWSSIGSFEDRPSWASSGVQAEKSSAQSLLIVSFAPA